MIQLNRELIYTYAGFGNNTPDKNTIEIIEYRIQEIDKKISPKWLARVYDIKGSFIPDLNIDIPGQSAKELLESSDKVILMATTLGAQVDQWINRQMIRDVSTGLIYDAIASAAIESFIETIDYKLRARYLKQDLYLTDRFSPGYGDVNLEFSQKICQILDTQRQIGLMYSPSGLLTPRKSITAFIGISNCKQKLRNRSCSNCMLKDDCSFKKNGVICHDR